MDIENEEGYPRQIRRSTEQRPGQLGKRGVADGTRDMPTAAAARVPAFRGTRVG